MSGDKLGTVVGDVGVLFLSNTNSLTRLIILVLTRHT